MIAVGVTTLNANVRCTTPQRVAAFCGVSVPRHVPIIARLLVSWAWPQLKTDVLVRQPILAAILLLVFALSARADPEKNYLLHCSGCHLPNGIGDPPNAPSLRDTIGKIVATPEGRDYIIRVPGSSQTPMSDEQLADVLNWMLTEFNRETLPKNFKPLSANEVSQSRRQILADPLKYRARLWPDY